MTTYGVSVDRDLTLKHADTRDGLKSWMTMIKKYNNDSDYETQIERLEAIWEQSTTTATKGDLFNRSQTTRTILQNSMF